MLNNTIRILNFDVSVVKQKNLASRYQFEAIDLKGLAPDARYFSSAKTRALVESRIKGSSKNCVTFLGSGDFHHISEILISQFTEPISVIDFDFHPDWDTLPPRYGCGSWVSEVLRKENIQKFIIAGASSNDLDSFNIQSGNLSALKDNRLEIYPYSHKHSVTFLKIVPENVSLRVERGIFFNKIFWQELKSKNLKEFFQGVLSRLSEKKVYVSIDKDCLENNYALTNWEEGLLSLDELLLMLGLIKQNLEIVGVDITGEYSPVSVKGLFKRSASYFDHPRKVKAEALPEENITLLNEDTNLKILKLLLS